MKAENVDSADEITVEEAARRIKHSAKTIRNWIYARELGEAQGLKYYRRRPVIIWPLFERWIATRSGPRAMEHAR